MKTRAIILMTAVVLTLSGGSYTAADTIDKLDFDFMAEVVENLVIFFLFHHR